MANLFLDMRYPLVGDHTSLSFLKIRCCMELGHYQAHHNPLSCMLMSVFGGEFLFGGPLGYRRDWRKGRCLLVVAAEADFPLLRHDGEACDTILQIRGCRAIGGFDGAYATSWREILQLVLILSVARVCHNECGFSKLVFDDCRTSDGLID